MKKKVLKMVFAILGVIVLIVVGYVSYVFLSYNRIEDLQEITVSGEGSLTEAQVGEEYVILTQNEGFGAYTADFTFFMDGGKQSWANSKDSVVWCVDEAAQKMLSFEPDFVLFQEVDTDSTRSYHVNELAQLDEHFKGFSRAFAVNYHSAFLMYPLTQPHGKSNSGIVTYSKVNMTSSMRRSLPISTSFSKILDLDRCYSVSRMNTDNGKEFVLFNIHSSAYGGNDQIRTAQMTMLFNDMKKEYAAGNYVICGGDFNHDFTGDSASILNAGKGGDYGWAQAFPKELLPAGLRQVTEYSDETLVATTRNCNVPYGEDSFTVILDGFIVSDNVEVTYVQNIDTGFVYSDHNPVLMKFCLK